MYNKQQQRKLVRRRRRIVVNCMCIALIGTAAWFVSSSVAEEKEALQCEVSDKTEQLQTVAEEKEALQREVSDKTEQLQTVAEEKEALQREVNRLELVVSNGAFFQGDTEWSANEVPYYDIKLSQELQLYTYTKCADLGITEDYELVLAMMWQESSYCPNITSGTNDYGLMQINKCNHGWLSEKLGITDFLDPYQSIDAGTHIIASLLMKYEDQHKALMAYNYGEGGARSHWNRGTYTSSYSRGVVEKQNILLDQLRLD